eukprot:scaffold55788_cov52-Attheya_sp.AAC.1
MGNNTETPSRDDEREVSFHDELDGRSSYASSTPKSVRSVRSYRLSMLDDNDAEPKGLGHARMGFQVIAAVKRLERRRLMAEHIRMKSAPQLPVVGELSPDRSQLEGQESDPLIHHTTGMFDPKNLKSPEPYASYNDVDMFSSNRGFDKHLKPSTYDTLWGLIFHKPINVLLFALPFAFLSHHLQWPPASIFWLNFLAMVPLASLLGDFTEELAAHTNQVIGGLINATFGNAVEVVVAIQALLANEIRVVQASMIGSIFSNLLLVLGGCFFFGGLKKSEQTFNSTAATANMSLLALSSIALVLPTPFAAYYEFHDQDVLVISRMAAGFLIFMYVQLLIFQLKTHAYLFEDEDGEEALLPFYVAIVGLVSITALIALLSDYLVGSIDGFCDSSGVSRTFVGLIILPIVGNAVEHITAVSVAMKDKMDLAMGIAVGSSVQISLFVVPIIVLIGWAIDRDMTLNFPQFEVILYILSVVTVSICLSNPRTNWLEGSLLMTTYCMIAVGFWYEKVRNF